MASPDNTAYRPAMPYDMPSQGPQQSPGRGSPSTPSAPSAHPHPNPSPQPPAVTGRIGVRCTVCSVGGGGSGFVQTILLVARCVPLHREDTVWGSRLRSRPHPSTVVPAGSQPGKSPIVLGKGSQSNLPRQGGEGESSAQGLPGTACEPFSVWVDRMTRLRTEVRHFAVPFVCGAQGVALSCAGTWSTLGACTPLNESGPTENGQNDRK